VLSVLLFFVGGEGIVVCHRIQLHCSPRHSERGAKNLIRGMVSFFIEQGYVHPVMADLIRHPRRPREGTSVIVQGYGVLCIATWYAHPMSC
jgi:hypothetical protein